MSWRDQDAKGFPVAVAIADLDHFKHINDTYGHMVGDTALCESASRMRALLRPYDAIGRYGGEEFLMVLPGLYLSRRLQTRRPAPHRYESGTCQDPRRHYRCHVQPGGGRQ